MYNYSIIMPVYNSSESLKKSIGSIQQQTYSNWELIVVNDGSTDNSLEILENYRIEDSRINIITQKNAGPGAARNAGIKQATGDYIAFLDSDDYWDNNFLQLVDKKNVENKNDIVFIEMINERQDGTQISVGNTYSFKNLTKDEILCCQMTGKMSWGMGKVIRKEIIDSNMSFGALNVGEEAIFSFDVLYNAQKIGFVEKPIYHYVQSPTGQHKKGDVDPWSIVVKAMRNHLIELGLYNDFEYAINSFAVKSLCICFYRFSCRYSMFEAVSSMKKKYNEYRKIYDFSKLSYLALDKSSIIIIRLAGIGFYFPIFLAAILRKKNLSY